VTVLGQILPDSRMEVLISCVLWCFCCGKQITTYLILHTVSGLS